jgi:acyl carrier protein
MSDEIESQVKSLVAATLGVDEAMIHPDTTLAGDLGADSLDFVSLILAIEERFQVDVHDEEAAEIVTFEQLVDYVTFALALREATLPGRRNGGAIATRRAPV